MNEENKEQDQINITDYAYREGQTVEIPAQALIGLMDFLTNVKLQETNRVFLEDYPKSSKVKKDKDGNVESVDIDWTNYESAQSYFSQEPVLARTLIGTVSEDLYLMLSSVHYENIKRGVAVKRGSVQAPNKEKVNL